MLDEFGVLSLDDEAIATDEEDSFSQLAGFSTCVSPSSQRYSLVSSLELLDSSWLPLLMTGFPDELDSSLALRMTLFVEDELDCFVSLAMTLLLDFS